MDRERQPSLFPEDALAVLTEKIDDGDADDDLAKDDAKALLADNGRYSESDVAHALDMLHNRGRIYYVNDRVRIAPTDE